MAGMGGNYYAALGMSVAENTGTKELEAASQGLTSALAGQVVNQGILTQANNDLYSVFNNTNALVKDIQTDQIEQQKLDERNKSKEILANEQYDKLEQSSNQILKDYEQFLTQDARDKMTSELTQSITGDRDIKTTTSHIDNLIDNMDYSDKGIKIQDYKTGNNVELKGNPLKGFNKDMIRNYIQNRDRLVSDYDSNILTKEQYAAITFLQTQGNFATLVKQETEAKNILNDIANGRMTPQMYQREAQILKETNPYFYKDKSVDDLAKLLSDTQDVMSGRFDGKKYTPYDKFNFDNAESKYKLSNIGNTVNTPKEYPQNKNDNIAEGRKQIDRFVSSSQSSKSAKLQETLDGKKEDDVRIDIFTGEVKPEYKQDKENRQSEINNQVQQTSNFMNKQNESIVKFDKDIDDANKKLKDGKITQGEYELEVFTAERGKKDVIEAMAINNTNTADAIKNINNSPTMKRINEHIKANGDFANIVRDDEGNISGKHKALLESINIDELRDLARQLSSVKNLMQYEIEANPELKTTLEPLLEQISTQYDLVDSIGKTKNKMNQYDQYYNKEIVNENELLRIQPELLKRHEEILKLQKNGDISRELDEERIIVDESIDKNNNTSYNFPLGYTQNNSSQSAIDSSKKFYAFTTNKNSIKDAQGNHTVIDKTTTNRTLEGVKILTARYLDPQSYDAYWKQFSTHKDLAKYYKEFTQAAHDLDALLRTKDGIANSQIISNNNVQSLLTIMERNMRNALAKMNEDANIANNHTIITKQGGLFGSEANNKIFRKDFETIIRYKTTKNEKGHLILDPSAAIEDPVKFNIGLSRALRKNQ